MTHVDVVVVEPLDLWLVTVVVGETAFVPTETAHTVDAASQVDVGLTGDGLAEGDTHIQRVARHVDRQVAV